MGPWTEIAVTSLGISGVTAISSISQSVTPETNLPKQDVLSANGATIYSRTYNIVTDTWGTWTTIVVGQIGIPDDTATRGEPITGT